MPYKLDLTLHSLPDSLNKALRGNRMKYFRKNRRWDLLIFGMVRNRLPEKPLQKARISIVRHAARTLDYDGLVGSMKPVVDALVSSGVLADDNWFVTGPWIIDQVQRPKSEGPLLNIRVEEEPLNDADLKRIAACEKRKTRQRQSGKPAR